jgi:hypothetical protein
MTGELSCINGCGAMEKQVNELREDLAKLRGELRTEIEKVRSEIHQGASRMVLWMIGIAVASMGAIVGLAIKFLPAIQGTPSP